MCSTQRESPHCKQKWVQYEGSAIAKVESGSQGIKDCSVWDVLQRKGQVDGVCVPQGRSVNYYNVMALYNVLLRQDTLSNKVKNILSWDPSGQINLKKKSLWYFIMLPTEKILISEHKRSRELPIVFQPQSPANQSLDNCIWRLTAALTWHFIKSSTKETKK